MPRALPWVCFGLGGFAAVVAFASPARAQMEPGKATVVGEVLVLEGTEDLVNEDGSRASLLMSGVARRAIQTLGDKFHAIAVWTTFDDKSANAAAYESTIRVDVRGLGQRLLDRGSEFGSKNRLRSMVNMKRLWLNAGDTKESWRNVFAVWGQEIGHRWLATLKLRDPRTGRDSDILLGRQCAHWSRFVDTQGSVFDGVGWKDNKDGTFTVTEQNVRYGLLDLYAMGVMAPDELPSMFFIDEIPGYRHPGCSNFDRTRFPTDRTLTGKRIDFGIADIIGANGPRLPGVDELIDGEVQDYSRELQVLLTRPGESVDSTIAKNAVRRLEQGRGWWEQWMSEATGRRMVACTKISADCGDPRSDVVDLRWDSEAKGSALGPVDVMVANPGGRESTGIEATVTVRSRGEGSAGELKASTKLSKLAAGETQAMRVQLDLSRWPCGTAVDVKASTQSDFHQNRRRSVEVIGAQRALKDDLESESGWTVNPDGDDTSTGARWERAKPEFDEIGDTVIQPAAAKSGKLAFVTGAAAGTKDSLVREGKSTVESPAFAVAGLRGPHLRYWVSFAGLAASATGTVAPSASAQLIVQAGPPGGPFVEVDRLTGEVTAGYVQRVAAIPAEALAGKDLRLRFVANDTATRAGGVEAAIDDIEILSLGPACFGESRDAGSADQGQAAAAQSQGCDCALGKKNRPSRWGGLGLLMLVVGCLIRRSVSVISSRVPRA